MQLTQVFILCNLINFIASLKDLLSKKTTFSNSNDLIFTFSIIFFNRFNLFKELVAKINISIVFISEIFFTKIIV